MNFKYYAVPTFIELNTLLTCHNIFYVLRNS